jgi:hypothetical protein
MTSRRGITLAILIGVVGLTGCGSSSSSNSSSSTSSSSTSSASSGISVAAYTAEVNKLCLTNNDQIKALPVSVETTAAGLDKLLSIAQATLARIKQIEPPSSIKTSVENWLAAVEQTEQTAIKLVAAAKAGNQNEFKSLTAEGKTDSARTMADARALGLPACAATSEPSGH